MASETQQLQWNVYILECCDGSFYTGSTNNISKRVASHNKGTGSRYTRSHLPVTLIYSEICTDRSAACKRESEIKKLSRVQKKKIISQFLNNECR